MYSKKNVKLEPRIIEVIIDNFITIPDILQCLIKKVIVQRN